MRYSRKEIIEIIHKYLKENLGIKITIYWGEEDKKISLYLEDEEISEYWFK